MSSVNTLPRRRSLIVALLGIAIVVLATSGVVLGSFGPGQDVQSDGSNEMVLAQEDDAATDEADDAVLDAASLPVTYEVFLSRDPFESIMPPEPVAVDPGDPASPADPSAPDDPSRPVDPSRPDDKEDGICRTGAEAVCAGTVIVVTDTSAGSATIEVNGTPYVAFPGQTFATNFTLLRIEGACVDLLYLNGDEAETLRQCVGGTTVK